MLVIIYNVTTLLSCNAMKSRVKMWRGGEVVVVMLVVGKQQGPLEPEAPCIDGANGKFGRGHNPRREQMS